MPGKVPSYCESLLTAVTDLGDSSPAAANYLLLEIAVSLRLISENLELFSECIHRGKSSTRTFSVSDDYQEWKGNLGI